MEKKKKRKKRQRKARKNPASHLTAVSIQLLKLLFNYLDRQKKTGRGVFLLLFFFWEEKEMGRVWSLINVNQYLITCTNVAQITISRNLSV